MRDMKKSVIRKGVVGAVAAGTIAYSSLSGLMIENVYAAEEVGQIETINPKSTTQNVIDEKQFKQQTLKMVAKKLDVKEKALAKEVNKGENLKVIAEKFGANPYRLIKDVAKDWKSFMNKRTEEGKVSPKAVKVVEKNKMAWLRDFFNRPKA